MKLPNAFDTYVKKKTLRKISVDKSRSAFLVESAQTSLEGLNEIIEKIGINDKNANSIVKDSYDIVMSLIRAKLLLEGYTASGQHSHEAEVSYLKKLDFPDSEVSFLNELRYSRNSVSYYGKILDKEYANKTFEFLNKIYPKLKKLV